MKKVILFFIFLIGYGVNSQIQGSIDTSFDIGKGFSRYGSPSVLMLQPDGKVLAGGYFSEYKGEDYNGLVRLNPDGSIDYSFDIGMGFNREVKTIALQPDGKILVGGDFTEFDGNIHNKLVRLNSDGSLDESFDIGIGFDHGVNSIVVQQDSKILVKGFFNNFKGQGVGKVIRLDIDGNKDTSFDFAEFENLGLSTGILLQSDGKILLGGYFDGEFKVYRFNSDGSIDNSFDVGTGFNYPINDIALQQDEKILVVGSFDFVNGQSQKRMTRLNHDGSIDSSFTSPWTGFTSSLSKIILQPDGKIIVFGRFSGQLQKGMVRLNVDGSHDTNFTVEEGFHYNATTNDIGISAGPIDALCLSNGKIIVGGFFSYYNQQQQNSLSCLNNDGSLDVTFSAGTGFGNIAAIHSILIQPDSKILVGGHFNNYNGYSYSGLIRLNSDGSVDTSFTTGIGFNNPVYSIALQPDGKIIVGGNFFRFDGQEYNNIIRFNSDGSIDTSFNIGTGFDLQVQSIAIQSDGKIIVGGIYYNYNGVSRNSIVRLKVDGTIDNTFNVGEGFNNAVNKVIILPDGRILAGGLFKEYKGEIRNHFACLHSNGSLDPVFGAFVAFNQQVKSIALREDGKVIVGGDFTTYNASYKNKIVLLNSSGFANGFFDSFIGFDDIVNSVASYSDNKILAGGNFRTYNNQYQNRISVLNSDGSIDTSFDFGTGFNNQVNILAIQPDGKILVGGDFTYYNDQNYKGIIRLNGVNMLSSSDNRHNKVKIYPNPTSGIIYIEGQNSYQGYEIYNLMGQKLLFGRIDNNSNIDMQELNKGTYLIKLLTNQGDTLTKKIIKQ